MLNATSPLAALAARAPHTFAVQLPDLAGVLLTTVIFTVFGLLVFGLAYLFIVKASPFPLDALINAGHAPLPALLTSQVDRRVALLAAAAVHG